MNNAAPSLGISGRIARSFLTMSCTWFGWSCCAEPVTDVPPHVVRRGGGHHRSGAVFALEPDHLPGDHVERVVPADGFVARFPALMGVAAAGPGGVRGPADIEVDPLERRQDALGRVDGGLVRHRPVGKGRLARWGELAVSRLDRPRRTVARRPVRGGRCGRSCRPSRRHGRAACREVSQSLCRCHHLLHRPGGRYSKLPVDRLLFALNYRLCSGLSTATRAAVPPKGAEREQEGWLQVPNG